MRKVLVVDDEKLIVKGIKFSLEQDEMQVDCAYDGEEALEKAKENQYDIILLDLMLPKMDGFEVLKHMTEEDWISNVPVIMISSEDSENYIRRAYEMGVTDYINRPFDANIVYQRVSNTVKLYAKQRRLMALVT